MVTEVEKMNLSELITVKTLEAEENAFDAPLKHTPYRAELRLLSCVQRGDVSALMSELEQLDLSIIAGKMSTNELTQYKYLGVSVMTLATRYAIQGGISEKEAYALSDRVIMQIDSLDSKAEIQNFVASEILSLTQAVGQIKARPKHSPHVRRCISYINENICSKLSVAELSKVCGISPDYLSQIFKEEIGENLSTYITLKKLEAAKNMIMQNKSYSEICLSLGFSSQSHFITVFKKHFGMTPSEYRKLTK